MAGGCQYSEQTDSVSMHISECIMYLCIGGLLSYIFGFFSLIDTFGKICKMHKTNLHLFQLFKSCIGEIKN